jgi:hypothetical protein
MEDLLNSFFDPVKEYLSDFMFSYLGMINVYMGDAINVLTSGSVWGVSFGSGVAIVLGVTTGLGATILSICMMMELLTIMTRSDILKIETAILVIGKYMVSVGIIAAAPDIMETLYYALGPSLVAGIAPSIDLTGALWAEIEATIADMNAFDVIILFVTMFLPLLGVLVSTFVVFVMTAARIFELNVYCAIAPIPCAFFPYSEGSSGFNQTTIRFFKSYAAICLTGGVMAVCYQIYGSALPAALAAPGVGIAEGMAKICFLSLLLALAITKCSGWAKAAMGVG